MAWDFLRWGNNKLPPISAERLNNLGDGIKGAYDEIGELRSRSGTSVAGAVDTFGDLVNHMDVEDGLAFVVVDEVAMYIRHRPALSGWQGPVPMQGSATSAAVGNVLTIAGPARNAADARADARIGAFGVVKPADAERVVFVTPRGNDSNDGLTLARAKATIPAAVATLGSLSGTIQLSAGTVNLASTIAGNYEVRGAGQGLTTINYTGTGAAFTSATPNTRTYRGGFYDLILTGPGKATATTGIDLVSVSEAYLQNVTVASFGTGIRIRSSINGGAVYNRLISVKAQNCTTGIFLEPSGSNGNVLNMCRANLCDVGFKILDSNNNQIIAAQIEMCVLGVHIDASSQSLSDYNALSFCRFENNTTAWETTPLVRYTHITEPKTFGTYVYVDNGTATNHTGAAANQPNYRSSARSDPAGSWLFTRTANGGTENPAFLVRDTNSSAGTPVTYQAETARLTGFFYRGRYNGSRVWDVSASGHTFMANRTVTPSAPTGGGILFVDAGALKFIGSNGTVTTLAPA